MVILVNMGTDDWNGQELAAKIMVTDSNRSLNKIATSQISI